MPAPSSFRVVAWTPTLRWVVNVLTWLALANLALIGAVVWGDLLEGSSRAPPLLVLITVVSGTVVPRLLATSFRMFCTGTAELTPERLRISVGRLEVDVPRDRITAVDAWRIPAPAPGVTLRLGSGRRLERELQPLGADDVALAEALGLRLREARLSPFGRARVALHRADLRARVFKYGFYPLVPMVLIFRVHQLLAYGGAFGEYQLHGLFAYLRSAVLDMGATLAHLVVLAGVVRVFVELVALIDGLLAPGRARKTRRAAEWASRIVYYGGIPAALAFAFLR